MPAFEHIVILTGAGLSAESGVSTFRDKDGIWAKVDYLDVATPEGFARNPSLVHEFYNSRRQGLAQVAPNAAHVALARLQQEHRGTVTIVTQNIDNLHEAAGSKDLIHMHGELMRALCSLCRHSTHWTEALSIDTQCPRCGGAGGMRPDVVWFGEMPYHMARIELALLAADLFISIGTSGNVYPAAGFVAEAKLSGALAVELNLEPSQGAGLFDHCTHGPATKIVPDYVAQLLEESG